MLIFERESFVIQKNQFKVITAFNQDFQPKVTGTSTKKIRKEIKAIN